MEPAFPASCAPAGPIGWLQPYWLFFATSILVGVALARWRATRSGIAPAELTEFSAWLVVGGFVSAHALDMAFYHPASLRQPWRLLLLWNGTCSFGAFIGAIVAAFLWKAWRGGGKSILPHWDVVLSVLPAAWILGRSGCAWVHDHPGIPSHHLLAVNFPASQGGPRWDLGLLEMLFAIALTVLIAPTWRRTLPVGTYVAIVPLAYAPSRFLMDFLRETDAHGGDLRWGSLTFAQWMCVPLFLFALWRLARLRMAQSARRVPQHASSSPGPRPQNEARRPNPP